LSVFSCDCISNIYSLYCFKTFSNLLLVGNVIECGRKFVPGDRSSWHLCLCYFKVLFLANCYCLNKLLLVPGRFKSKQRFVTLYLILMHAPCWARLDNFIVEWRTFQLYLDIKTWLCDKRTRKFSLSSINFQSCLFCLTWSPLSEQPSTNRLIVLLYKLPTIGNRSNRGSNYETRLDRG